VTDQRIPAYAIAYVRAVAFGAEIIQYMREIDATLTPFDGELVVHGGRKRPMEGEWDGDIVIIRFPDYAPALRWYDSADYRHILPIASAELGVDRSHRRGGRTRTHRGVEGGRDVERSCRPGKSRHRVCRRRRDQIRFPLQPAVQHAGPER
jgi:uncharacterized protein (DUF1330 family)